MIIEWVPFDFQIAEKVIQMTYMLNDFESPKPRKRAVELVSRDNWFVALGP